MNTLVERAGISQSELVIKVERGSPVSPYAGTQPRLSVARRLDAIPDFLSGIGLIDDAVVVGAVASTLAIDIARFLEWERHENSK